RIALDDDDDDDVLGVLTLDSRVDVVVPVESIRATSERFANTACGFFLVKLHGVPVMTFRDGGLSAIAMKIVEVVVMPKLTREGFYTCTVRVEYDLETLRYVCCKVQLHGVPVMTFRDGGLRAIAMKIVEVVVMPKLTREGFYTCTVRVEYDLETLRDVCCKVFGHIQKECPKNPGLGSSQALRGVSVGPKVIFKPSK
nr:hypothetical protein [Tanacetum cinerariifolium]